jgi:hypothetical protein
LGTQVPQIFRTNPQIFQVFNLTMELVSHQALGKVRLSGALVPRARRQDGNQPLVDPLQNLPNAGLGKVKLFRQLAGGELLQVVLAVDLQVARSGGQKRLVPASMVSAAVSGSRCVGMGRHGRFLKKLAAKW